MQKKTKKIINQLAKENNLDPKDVEFAIRSYYTEVRRLLEEGDLTNFKSMNLVNIYGFTRFVPRTKRIREHNERRKEQYEYFLQGISNPGENFTVVQY